MDGASSDKRRVLPHTVSKVPGRRSKNIKTLVPQLLKYRHTYFYISIDGVIVLPVNRCADHISLKLK